MIFGFGWSLLAFIIIPVVLVLKRKGFGRPEAFYYPETAAAKAAFQGGRRPGSGIREGLRICAISALIIAFARPQVVQSVVEITSSGLDIILALDTSGSMSARDYEPLNRLEAAKAEIRDFLAQKKNNRLGLVAFAAQAFTVCPLTLDYHVLELLVGNLQIGMTSDGTAIGMAIAASVIRLKDSAASAKVIILLTDGRNNAGRLEPVTAAEMAAALKIKIYTIGMGQPGGAPIVLKNAAGEDTVLLNADGSVYREQVDEELLQQIAKLTGGLFFRASDKKKLKAIYSHIRDLEQAQLKSKIFTAKRDIGHYFIMLAGIMLLLEMLLGFTIEQRLP